MYVAAHGVTCYFPPNTWLRTMQRNSARRSIKQLSGLPTVQGGLSRLAADRVRRAGIKLEPLLSRVGLTIDQMDDPELRINALNQIAFLEAAAKRLRMISSAF